MCAKLPLEIQLVLAGWFIRNIENYQKKSRELLLQVGTLHRSDFLNYIPPHATICFGQMLRQYLLLSCPCSRAQVLSWTSRKLLEVKELLPFWSTHKSWPQRSNTCIQPLVIAIKQRASIGLEWERPSWKKRIV